MNISYEDITLFQLERFKLFVDTNSELVKPHYKNFSKYGFYWNQNWQTHWNCDYATSYRPIAHKPILRAGFFVLGQIYNPKDTPTELHVLYDTDHGLCSAHVPDFLFDSDLSDEDVKDNMRELYSREYEAWLSHIKAQRQDEVARALQSVKEIEEYGIAR